MSLICFCQKIHTTTNMRRRKKKKIYAETYYESFLRSKQNIWTTSTGSTTKITCFWTIVSTGLRHQTRPFFLLNLSTLIRDFSGLLVFLDFSSWLSTLFLETSGRQQPSWNVSVRPFSEGLLCFFVASVAFVFVEPFLGPLGLEIETTNFFRCFMNSG